MLAGTRYHTRVRRGIVLVLVLAMLGLLALIGVTFATLSGQARINARHFAQSVVRPRHDELLDFALLQLINDTDDPRSVIRGHSLARDMFGNDASNNGHLTVNPAGGPMTIQAAGPVTITMQGLPAANYYAIQTWLPAPSNSAANGQALFGYDFTRWLIRLTVQGSPIPRSPDQTLEILIDDYGQFGNLTGYSGRGYHTFYVSHSGVDATTGLNNPTQGIVNNQLVQPVPNVPFILDGRWLHAFNGPGMGTQSTAVTINYGNYADLTLNVPNSTYGNFRYNGLNPNDVGMDEDYDACDLENWVLAIQSADGQVIVPSFHRPGIVRYQDAAHPMDWDGTSGGFRYPNGTLGMPNLDSVARILRPVAADGHDAATFHDLVPDPNTGKITYDVDNDGDGVNDSVWLDLGYPARLDANGNLYKPLFAFMVIGLNGRIPLNTAGNLAEDGATHAQHLGNSVSEIDPTYGLQNALLPGPAADPFNVTGNGVPPLTSNTQVDNAGIDVRVTQLRNLLAGTRPQIHPLLAPNTAVNGDDNIVYGSWPGSTGPGIAYYLPNGIADGDDAIFTTDPVSGDPLVRRTTPPVAGRWGESASVPGVPFNTPSGTSAGLIQPIYDNPIRAGYSFDVTDLLNNFGYANTPFPRDAADDNCNAFDVFPARLTGEISDLDFYDAAGAMLLPVERMRRFVTPLDINGSGSVGMWTTATGPPSDTGADNYGRVQFFSYNRPAGVAGAINITPGNNYGAIGYGTWNAGTLTPWQTGTTYQPDVTNNPFHGYEFSKLPNLFQGAGVLADGTNPNVPLAGGMPIDQNQDPTYTSYPDAFNTYDNKVNSSGRLSLVNEADEMNLYAPKPLLDSPYGPSDLEWLYRQADVDRVNLTSRLSQLAPVSFTNTIDGQRRRRLYALDSWESNGFVWANDNPGASGLPNGTGVFAHNSWFTPTQSPTFSVLGANPNVFNNPNVLPTPSLAHRDRKINLNYPLPVSSDCNEPIRQKWIGDTYQLIKRVLPPTSVDSPEELAQLSQFVVNIIDFRDPDATMTHWQSPDVFITPSPSPMANPALSLAPIDGSSVLLDQYGIEYNPVAINEVLAYGFQSRSTPDPKSAQYTNRFFIELVNTLTASYSATFDYTNNIVQTRRTPNQINQNNYYGYGPIPGSATPTTPTGGNIPNPTTPPYQASTLDLGGCSYTAGDPYSGGCWDLVFTADTPQARPDPYRGELVNFNEASVAIPTTYYSVIPLNRDSVTTTSGAGGGNNANAPNGGDVTLIPLSPTATSVPSTTPVNLPNPNPPSNILTPPPPPITYFYVIGSPTPTSGNEANAIANASNTPGSPCVTQFLTNTFDPMAPAGPGNTPPGTIWQPGVLPGVTFDEAKGQYIPPSNYAAKLPAYVTPPAGATAPAQYFWVCLRRPANPFAPVSVANPMCVVDAMRFPYIDGTASPGVAWTTAGQGANGGLLTPPVGVGGSTNPNTIYSAQRLQPYRGGHAVPMPNAGAGALDAQGAMTSNLPPDTRYGFTDQIAPPQNFAYSARGGATYQGTCGFANSGAGKGPASTNYIYHSLGFPNDSAENWDYFAFNDRDFSSVAELLLVPGCPPGLFTKQFAEFAPSQMNAADIFSTVSPTITPTSNNLAMKGTSAAGALPNPVFIQPVTSFSTATLPFLSVSVATASTALVTPPQQGSTTILPTFVPALPTLSLTQPDGVNPPIPEPIQPHTFPYLVDRFFYTGASTFYYPPTGGQMDPGATSLAVANRMPVVGGPGGDGWFKMFEFFEVPSQMIGAIGPVAQGTNFDWARQDSKPGMMNINLIVDEEAFFGIFGSLDASRGYNQTLLNSIELPLLSVPNANGQSVLPYAMPLATMNNNAPPIPRGAPPVPLVVSAIQPNGAPNYAYPVTDQTQSIRHGYTAVDPIGLAINAAANGGTPAQPYPVGNRIKAAFAQFLWSRHGGSGYLFGHGSGISGENSAVVTPIVTANTGQIPSERPFHSLSYPDIDYTIMRPAALPPSTISNPAMANGNAALNAAALYTTQTPSVGGFDFLSSTSFYSPFLGGSAGYTGDPGVRNPFFNQGYATSQPGGTKPYPIYPAEPNTVPEGVPIPANVAFPFPGNTITAKGIAMPPPIPPARLFQIPDAYGAGQMQALLYAGDGTVVPPAVSNATDSGDPWINNTAPNQSGQVVPTSATYTLNNGFNSLMWSGGVYFPNANDTAPPVSAAGVLTPTTIQKTSPYGNVTVTPGNLVPYNGYGTVPAPPNSELNGPYLGATSATGGSGNIDNRQHPYWRTELLQKAMNLTTVRTHQYAVWITVGFFEVKRQGNIGMLAQGLPQLTFDVMGPEPCALDGTRIRYRGFFLVDRLKLTGFNPGDTGACHSAVVYRKVIE